MIHFDPVTHRYSDGKKIIPSVTTIISEFFPKDPSIPEGNWERARERGEVYHKTLELFDKGTLGTYDPKLQWVIDAWGDWKKDKKILEIESPKAHFEGLYAGTIDRVVKYQDKVAIVDIKTSSYIKLAPLQLHAYWHMSDGNELLVVQIRDGKLKEIKIEIEQDLLDMFIGMAKLYHWKRQNGIVKEAW